MGNSSRYVRYRPPYATLTPQLIALLVEERIGRNGWAVMAALCMDVRADRTLGKKPARLVSALTGLSGKQVARGMAELKAHGIIAPVIVRDEDGRRRTDRPCYGHTAQHCITLDAWKRIADGFDIE